MGTASQSLFLGLKFADVNVEFVKPYVSELEIRVRFVPKKISVFFQFWTASKNLNWLNWTDSSAWTWVRLLGSGGQESPLVMMDEVAAWKLEVLTHTWRCSSSHMPLFNKQADQNKVFQVSSSTIQYCRASKSNVQVTISSVQATQWQRFRTGMGALAAEIVVKSEWSAPWWPMLDMINSHWK